MRAGEKAELEENLAQRERGFPGVPGGKVLPRKRERNGEQAEAEAVEPRRADAGGNQSASRETPDRTRCTRCGRQAAGIRRPAGLAARLAAGSNRRIRKTVRPVVWEGAGAQSPIPDPIVGRPLCRPGT